MDAVRFEDFSYHYPKTGKGLNRVMLAIPAGSFTVLTGANGSGKTTLASIIQNLYPLKNGKIMSTKGTRGGMNAGYNTNRMHQPAAQYPVFFSYYLIYINLLRKGEINYGITESYNQQPTGTSHETGRSIR